MFGTKSIGGTVKEIVPNSSRQEFWNGELVASPLIPWRTLRQTVARSPKISAKISGFAWESWIYMA
jgi:hypothetical protein